MKKTAWLLWIVVLCAGLVRAQSFNRELPNAQVQAQLNPRMFPNQDAVIVLKELVRKVDQTTFSPDGSFLFSGLSTAERKVLIVKLFNEAAIKRYGSFEYEYMDFNIEELRTIFSASVRVLKPDGKVWVMPKEMIKPEALGEYQEMVFARKVLFKIPDLAPGDILQIEYTCQKWFDTDARLMYYFNEPDFTVYSNFSLVMPKGTRLKHFALPAGKVGDPVVTQDKNDDESDIYFWSLRNVPAIPDEPYAVPFADQAMMTAVMVEKWGKGRGEIKTDWQSQATEYYKNLLDGKGVKRKMVEDLNMPLAMRKAGEWADDTERWKVCDALYTALRKRFVLNGMTGIAPNAENLKTIFKSSRGGSSDLAYIMLRILRDNDFSARPALIRDRREGGFSKDIPTLGWFDRLGVWVSIGGKERLFDFDEAVPYGYRLPWFLQGVEVLVIDKNAYEFKSAGAPSTAADNTIQEEHRLGFGDNGAIRDRVVLTLNGMPAERYRSARYDMDATSLTKSEKDRFSAIMDKVDEAVANDFRQEETVVVTAGGTLKNPVEEVESLLTFKLPNISLTAWRDDLFSSLRFSDLDFRAPFRFRFRYSVSLPAGYTVKGQLVDRTLHGANEMTAAVSYNLEGGTLQVEMVVTIPHRTLPKAAYPELMKFLDAALNEINRDLVLQKGSTQP